MTEQKINNIQEILVHQEQQIEDLSRMVVKQWDEIDALKKRVQRLHDKVQSVEESSAAEGESLSVTESAARDKPPHY